MNLIFVTLFTSVLPDYFIPPVVTFTQKESCSFLCSLNISVFPKTSCTCAVDRTLKLNTLAVTGIVSCKTVWLMDNVRLRSLWQTEWQRISQCWQFNDLGFTDLWYSKAKLCSSIATGIQTHCEKKIKYEETLQGAREDSLQIYK
jgi:hypothetical protein